MIKKEVIKNNPAYAIVASYSSVSIKLHYIEYDINDTIYFSIDTYNYVNDTIKTSYHKSRIYYNNAGEAFFKYNGIRIYFNTCIRL